MTCGVTSASAALYLSAALENDHAGFTAPCMPKAAVLPPLILTTNRS